LMRIYTIFMVFGLRFGLPIGLCVCIVYKISNPANNAYAYTTTEMDNEKIMYGFLDKINDTLLNRLSVTLTHTVIIGATIVPQNQLLQRRFYM